MYNYKLMFTHAGCKVKRPVAFKHREKFNYADASEEGIKNLILQNCSKCGELHEPHDYILIDCKRTSDIGSHIDPVPYYNELFPARPTDEENYTFNF